MAKFLLCGLLSGVVVSHAVSAETASSRTEQGGNSYAAYVAEAAQRFGRFLRKAMPVLLAGLSLIGTVAMLWVGGGIILHGMHELGLHSLSDWAHDAEVAVEAATGSLAGILGWATYAALSALVGLALGMIIALVLHKVLKVGNEDGAH